ncbi:MAG: GT4 family glycosyltransferase PelF, partial [Bacillota bacterium]
MMTTEGTYPFHLGGVSTWCDALTKGVPAVDFILYAILMNPFVTQKFRTSPNVKELIKVPLWGTEEPSEHLTHIPFSSVYLAKRRTGEAVIRSDFVPLFEGLVRQLTADEGRSVPAVARTLFEMYKYFRQYDYQTTFKSPSVWETFKRVTLEEVGRLGRRDTIPTLFDLTESLGWLYRFFTILNTPLPKVHVTHSAAAAFCGIPCVISKLENKTPYLLSEHGIYLREQYIGTARMRLSMYSRRFLLNLVTTVAQLSYEFADQVSPVCQFNTRWERRMGVPEGRIRVVYNGVDPGIYAPAPDKAQVRRPPTVVCVARIDPIKDMETLIRTAALVRQAVPGVKFVVYGAPSSQSYFERCYKLRSELALDEVFIFAGHTNDVAAAFRTADVVALSSISEGFPYSVVEAMMSGKPIVATDVGGVREAVEGCGFVVPPRSPDKMATALV